MSDLSILLSFPKQRIKQICVGKANKILLFYCHLKIVNVFDGNASLKQ